MPSPSRRRFLLASAAATSACAADLSFLLPLSHASARDTAVDPERVVPGDDLAALVRLIRNTPRDQCVATLVRQLRGGLSYQGFLTALFMAALEHGDPHQVAQVYSAHRISSDARIEERLLPLFWALDRVRGGFDEEEAKARRPAAPLTNLPTAARAAAAFDDAMAALDADAAQRAVVALARGEGARRAFARLFSHAPRRTAGTLGHHPIVVANAWRTLEAMGWQHAEPVLRYIVGSLAQNDADRTYEPNRGRIEKTFPRLAAGRAGDGHSHGATIELYGVLRRGDTDGACDVVCSQLAAGVPAGAVWDALHLVAADLLFRYKTGGLPIGGALIHAVTSTNALRFCFDCTGDDRARLLLLLQGAGALCDVFVRPARAESQLRDMSLLDLRAGGAGPPAKVADVFAMLPHKDNFYVEKDPSERLASDRACQVAFDCLGQSGNDAAFRSAARSFLCVKASPNPHDIKYPAAAFEDAALVDPRWRPHLLAASVHALHGTNSHDAPVLVQARAALR